MDTIHLLRRNMSHRCQLSAVILFLILLFQICNDIEYTCPDIWANCPDDGDFKVCTNCRLVEEVESRLIRYGVVENCYSGIRRRTAISIKCTFESR